MFITFEGGEGAGKTSLINRIQEMLQCEHPVLVTREPGGSPLGEQIRQWLLSHDDHVKVGLKAELLLFLASRAQHIEEVIRPALNAGKIVLCDRFNDSTIVYQGLARRLGLSYVQQLCELVCGDVVPELTFFLDIDPKIGLLRTVRRGTMDRIESEKLEFHESVRQGFLTLAKQSPLRIHTLDATQSQEQVFQEAAQVIKNKSRFKS
jgi:dTMP kinase